MLDWCWVKALSRRHVLAGDTTPEPGRQRGRLPGVGPQRARPGHGRAEGADHPQLRARRPGGPRGAGPAGQEHQPVPGPRRRGGCGRGRRVGAAVVERVIFAMVANRLSPTPLSKLAGCAWVAHRVFIDGLAEVDEDSCYRAMDVFLSVLAELQQAVFFSVANLLNLEVDILFFDTSSTYWETEATDDAL